MINTLNRRVTFDAFYSDEKNQKTEQIFFRLRKAFLVVTVTFDTLNLCFCEGLPFLTSVFLVNLNYQFHSIEKFCYTNGTEKNETN